MPHILPRCTSVPCIIDVVHAKLMREFECLALARIHIDETIQILNDARRWWDAFCVIVDEAFEGIQSQLYCQSTVVMQAVDQKMEAFLVQTLQLDPQTIRQVHDLIEQPS